MKTVKMNLDFLNGPIWKNVYDVKIGSLSQGSFSSMVSANSECTRHGEIHAAFSVYNTCVNSLDE